MVKRQLAKLTGNLYDQSSESYHHSLEELRSHLLAAGFKVSKKRDIERTLRVYVTRTGEYPLLNPIFDLHARDGNPSDLVEVLSIAILSTGKDLWIDRAVRSFEATDQCWFDPSTWPSRDYEIHGRFLLPILFDGPRGASRILYGPLHESLRAIHALLLRGRSL